MAVHRGAQAGVPSAPAAARWRRLACIGLGALLVSMLSLQSWGLGTAPAHDAKTRPLQDDALLTPVPAVVRPPAAAAGQPTAAGEPSGLAVGPRSTAALKYSSQRLIEGGS